MRLFNLLRYLICLLLIAAGIYVFTSIATFDTPWVKHNLPNLDNITNLVKIYFPFRPDTNNSKLTVIVGPRVVECEKPGPVDNIPLSKDISYQEKRDVASVLFPQAFESKNINSETGLHEDVYRFPGEVPSTAHFVWCGKKQFRFEDHLALISIIKIHYPQQIIFHYNELPMVDRGFYNTWFLELKQSVPHLSLKKTNVPLPCNTSKPLLYGLEQLAATNGGGVLFGERTIFTRIPEVMKASGIASYFTSTKETNVSRGYVVSTKGNLNETNVYMSDFEKYVMTHALKCVTVEEFNNKINAMSLSSSPVRVSDIPVCVRVTDRVYPIDIVNSSSPFDILARWIYYGKPERIQPVKDKDDSNLIPLISHYICLKAKGKTNPVFWSFGAYVCVLSALYIGGFERVYVHGDEEPIGEWWEKLKTENVTFVKIEKVETVFQQKVETPAHVSDVIRAQVLLQYGGAYQDWNVMWVNRVPEEDRRYETVFCLDWPLRGEWPDTMSFGMFLCKPGSEFLKIVAHSFRYYRDDLWAFNGQFLPYRMYERNPDKVLIDRKLQVCNYNGQNHPVWGEGYRRPLTETSKTMFFSWKEISAFHFTWPKWHKSISSYKGVKYGKDLFAEMGRKIFNLSGRMHELDDV